MECLYYDYSYDNQNVTVNIQEELIVDHTRTVSTKIADTNIAVYTITRNKGTTWPSNLWIEVI